jgi:hypothetical protein
MPAGAPTTTLFTFGRVVIGHRSFIVEDFRQQAADGRRAFSREISASTRPHDTHTHGETEPTTTIIIALLGGAH